MLYHSPICFLCIQTGNFKAHPPSLIHVNTSFCKQNKMVETPQQTKQCMMLSTVRSHQVCNFCSLTKKYFFPVRSVLLPVSSRLKIFSYTPPAPKTKFFQNQYSQSQKIVSNFEMANLLWELLLSFSWKLALTISFESDAPIFVRYIVFKKGF